MESSKCSLCFELFSSKESNQPLSLECGHTFCRACLTALQKKNKNHCPRDRHIKFDVSRLFPNETILKLLDISFEQKKKEKQDIFVCSNKHENSKLENNRIKFLSSEKKEFLCEKCYENFNLTGTNSLPIKFGLSDLKSEMKFLMEELKYLKTHVDSLLQIYEEIIESNKYKYSKEIAEIVQNTFTLLVKPFKEASSFKNFKLQSFLPEVPSNLPDSQKLYPLNSSMITPLSNSSFKISSDICSSEDLHWLSAQLSSHLKTNISLNKIFNATNHGFSSEIFHSLCDNKGPTVVIIQAATNNFIIGGFTTNNWESTEQYVSKECNRSFIFSVTRRSIHKIVRNKENAIIVNKKCGPVFGKLPSDLFLPNKCNENPAHCIVGRSYDSNMMKEDTKVNLVGDEKFLVKNYEVFQVIC